MAAVTSLSSCSSTTHLFFKGAPIFFSCRRTIASSCGLFDNRRSSIAIPNKGRFAPSLLIRSSSRVPILDICTDYISTSTASRGRSRKMQLRCFSTAAEAQNSTAPAIVEGNDDNTIREAANTLDIRVGKILKAWRHEEADSLYVEEVDIGEPEPRTICSGLVKYIPLHLFQDRNVIVFANLKPRNMRGVKSFGMLMAASDAAHENVELLVPPEHAVPGERVWFGSLDEKENLPEVASLNQVQKKKIWEQVQPHLKTDESCVVTLGMQHPMRTSAGVVICDSLKNANVS
ncbi:hypothetical protein OROMI_006473 [Orobanche minor]